MKRLLAGLTALTLAIVPMSSSVLAQEVVEEVGFLQAMGNTSSLKNYNDSQAIFGNLGSENEGMELEYRITLNNNTTDADTNTPSASTRFNGYVNVTFNENKEWKPFDSMKINARGEMRVIDMQDLYVNLNDLNITTQGAEEEVESDLAMARLMIEGMLGEWFKISLEELNSLGGMGVGGTLATSPAMFNNLFQADAEAAIRQLVEEMAAQRIKSMLYYQEQFGNHVNVFEGDYKAVIAENELEVLPIDVEAWLEKKVLNCVSLEEREAEMEMIKTEMEANPNKFPNDFEEDDFFGNGFVYGQTPEEDGFNYLECWTSYQASTDALSEAEMDAFYEVDYGSGEWLYEKENGWSYVVVYPASDEPRYRDNYLNHLDENAVEVDIQLWKEQGLFYCQGDEEYFGEMEMMEEEMMTDVDLEEVIQMEPVIPILEDELIEMTPAYLMDDLKNGLINPGCWYNENYDGPLNETQQQFVDLQMEYNGDWIHQDGKWFYIGGVYPQYSYEEEMAAIAAFEPDPALMEESMAPIRKGLDAFFAADLFHEREVLSGPNTGFNFFRVSNSGVVDLIKTFAQLADETISESDEMEMREFLNLMSLAGVYNIDNEDMVDNLYTRLKIRVPDEGHFEMNYRFKLNKKESTVTIKAPNDYQELDQEILMEGLMSL